MSEPDGNRDSAPPAPGSSSARPRRTGRAVLIVLCSALVLALVVGVLVVRLQREPQREEVQPAPTGSAPSASATASPTASAPSGCPVVTGAALEERAEDADAGQARVVQEGLSPQARALEVSGWTSGSESGSVGLSTVALQDAPEELASAGLSSALEVRTEGDTGRWAFALARTSDPDTFFEPGRTYRFQAWVRELDGRGEGIGLTVADPAYADRPTDERQVSQGQVRTWRLLSRTFVATAPGGARTGLYVTLPLGDSTVWQITGVSLARVEAPGPPRTDAAADTRIGYAGGGTVPDACAWVQETGAHGWGNAELQNYTRDGENTAVDPDGNLRITVAREDGGGAQDPQAEFTSGRMTTLGRIAVPSGSYVEASIQAPVGDGLWPAFWLIGANFPEVGWPASGEIDIFEGQGSRPDTARNAVHTATVADPTEHVQSGWGAEGGTIVLDESVDSRPHRYGVYFDSSVVRFFVDRVEIRSVLAEDARAAGWAWPFDRPQAIVLNVAVDSAEVSDDLALPAAMQVSPIGVWRGAVPR
ncbi:family 16 glycosylhydrolase [Kineococcus sp. SYSU DK003]|uniref:family 16 glycosylhydrolase n=1 Tax=Kineococcus sp. SYSU DK003 TaxID=3383124 RepID=UPI003D7C56AB